MSPRRAIRRLQRVTTLMAWIIIVLLSIIARMAGQCQEFKPAKQYKVEITCNPCKVQHGCISIVGDSVLYVNMRGEQLLSLRVERGFRYQNNDHYRLKSDGKYTGFFIVSYGGSSEAEKAYLIVAGKRRGEHYSRWYKFKKR